MFDRIARNSIIRRRNTPEAKLVAMVHIKLLAFQPGTSSGEACRDSLSIDRSLTALELGRISDVKIVRYSAIVLIKAIIVVEKRLIFITVANI